MLLGVKMCVAGGQKTWLKGEMHGWRLLDFELSSEIVNSLSSKEVVRVESDREQSSRIAGRLFCTKSKLESYSTAIVVYIDND